MSHSGKSGNDGAPEFRSQYDIEDEKESKFLRKAKESPFVPAGIVSALGALCYSAYKFKNRGDQKLSVYLIHTRVAAQGAVVGALTLGVLYTMINDYVLKPSKKE